MKPYTSMYVISILSTIFIASNQTSSSKKTSIHRQTIFHTEPKISLFFIQFYRILFTYEVASWSILK